MELVLGDVGNSYGGELHLMWFFIGVAIGFILGGMFCIWLGSFVGSNLRIPKSEAATILDKLTEEALQEQKVGNA